MENSLFLAIFSIHSLLLGILLFLFLAFYGEYTTLNQLHFYLSCRLSIISFVLSLVALFHRNSYNIQLVRTLPLANGALNMLRAVLTLEPLRHVPILVH